ncbi:exported hypothetical protein [Rubrivivax sp. A210]|uniref:helix-turn-helix domain-containing protein n=1 Tax=Rubrivivax sp. A210 TaxID=2772301 RepID=UPI00191B8CB7|nr:helix-turn-helix domain-containing protein [Rubrivivax sp. A210]CAD5369824.1 exported hypothetical protein [Rubrivivax sp. A210]
MFVRTQYFSLSALLLAATLALAAPAAGAGPAPDVLTLEETAQLLRLPAPAVLDLARSGGLPGRSLAGQWRFSRAALLDWLKGEPAAPALPAAELAALAGRGAAPAAAASPRAVPLLVAQQGTGDTAARSDPMGPARLATARWGVVLEVVPQARQDQSRPIPAVLQAFEVVTTATTLDGQPALQVAVGYFASREDAEAARAAALARFPAARVVDFGERKVVAGAATPAGTPASAPASPAAGRPAPQAANPAKAAAPAATTTAAATVGDKPTAPSADRIALRDQVVLLPGGTTTVDFGLAYGRAERNNYPALRVDQRTVTATLAARYGLADDLQVTARLPAMHRRVSTQVDPSLGASASDSQGHVGDLSTSLLGVAAHERMGRPNVIWSVDATLPTGPGDAGLGGGIVFSKSYDPVVLFGGLSYMRGLRVDAADSKRLLARNNFGFTLGYAYAINDTVALSTVLGGSYRNTAASGGGIKPAHESYQLQLGMTWQLGSGLYLEPSASIGLGGAAPDFTLSVNLPFSF